MTFLNIDDIDKTIYELIRKELVSLGLLPDILTSINYNLDKQALKESLPNGIIEVFGVSSWQNRDMKTLSRFVIDRTSILGGDIGGGGIVEEIIVNNGNEIINSYRLPSSRNLTYEIRFSTDSQAYELLSNKIISSVFGQGLNKSCLSDREGTVELFFNPIVKGSYNVSSYDFYERVFTIEVKNVIIENDVIQLSETNVPIKSIGFKVKDNQIEVTHIQS